MNKELKVMIWTALTILAMLLVVDNLIHLRSSAYISQGTYRSQTVALNRLRHPNINHSSERGNYPSLKKGNLKLIAVRHNDLLYILRGHRVIYIAHAVISLSPQTVAVNAARGEQNYHVKRGEESTATNWVSLGHLGYLETPQVVNKHRIHGNWLKRQERVPNTIEVSRQDAKWLQQLPKGTTVAIK